MKIRKESGFTLVEVIVVAAIIAILAGILVPMIFGQIDEARISRAKADIRSLSSSVYAFRKDVAAWPNCANATVLFGAGAIDTAALGVLGYDTTSLQRFADHLMVDDNNCYGTMWNGPYAPTVTEDPWGNSYFLSAVSFAGTNPVLIISAGPDGVVQTSAAITYALGDDIAIRVQ